MGRLARGLAARGNLVDVLTAAWQRDWPLRQRWHDVPLTRFPQPHQRVWGTARYLTSLARWLRARRNELDLVYVSMLKHDAYAAIRALSGAPVTLVLRAEGSGSGGDAQWQADAWYGGLIRGACRQAAAIVVPSQQIQGELQQRGYAPQQLHLIPNGVPLGPPRTTALRRRARAALATASEQFRAPLAPAPARTWITYTGRLVAAKGILDLVEAWSSLHHHYPHAVLLLVGDGPARQDIGLRVRELGLESSVLMPGEFPDTHDILAASDLFVLPSYEEGLSVALLEAMAAELPCIGTDVPGVQELLASERGWLVPPRAPQVLAQAIRAALDNPDYARAVAQSARQHVALHYSLDQAIDHHLDLFARLITARNHGQHGASNTPDHSHA